MKTFPHHPLIYYNQETKKSFFAEKKSFRVLKLLRVLSFRVLFGFLSDWVLIMVFSDTVLFEPSVIGSLKGPSVIDSSLGLSVLFFRYAGTFLSKGATALI